MLARSRWTLVAAIIAGLVGAPAVAAEAQRPSTSSSRAAAKKKAAAAKKKKAALRKKRAAAAKRRASARRRAAATAKAKKSRGGNMPPGWAWPPSPDMVAEGKACTDALDELGIAWKPAKAAPKIANPITLTDMELVGIKLVSTYRRGPHVMDCDLALGLANTLAAVYEAGVRELHFSRIHDYTTVRVNGVEKTTLSRHALGLAIDIRSFVDVDGREAKVLEDYPMGDLLLLKVEQLLTDTGGFRTILTPRNDPQSHDDHFHLEVRVDYTAPLPARPPS